MVSVRNFKSQKDNSSRIRKKFFPNPDPGGNKAPDLGSRIRNIAPRITLPVVSEHDIGFKILQKNHKLFQITLF
jgi:hypothetical protein